MILGIGTDIVEIKRIKKLVSKYDMNFISKILTPEEIDLMPDADPQEFIAGRFAAKEALVKAIGSREFSFSDVSILRDEKGRPFIKEESLRGILPQPNCTVHVSISHEREYAVAFVTIES